MTSFNLTYLLKSLISSTVTLEVRVQHKNFWGDTVQFIAQLRFFTAHSQNGVSLERLQSL